MNDLPGVCVCVLAHNEEKHLEATLSAICAGDDLTPVPVFVYANGCTDRTVAIARRFSGRHQQVVVRELPVASKPCAWNAAFAEHATEYIIFADGDIIPDTRAADILLETLAADPAAVIATCRQVPRSQGLTLQQRLVGYMQTPLHQDFLAGGFYAVRRLHLAELLSQQGLNGIPPGITGDDAYLDRLVGHDRLLVADCYSAYEPPGFKDYCRYLARLSWQNAQLKHFLPILKTSGSTSIWRRLSAKLSRNHCGIRLMSSLIAVSLRYAFKVLAAPVIHRIYCSLGPVRLDGAGILQSSTRTER